MTAAYRRVVRFFELSPLWALTLPVAGVLYGMEFVADKIPYIDSTWDAISTAIRPTAGAVIALLVAGDASTLGQALYAALGGGAALASHAVKSGIRLAINRLSAIGTTTSLRACRTSVGACT